MLRKRKSRRKFFGFEQLFILLLGLVLILLITYIFLFKHPLIFEITINSGLLSGGMSFLIGLFVVFVINIKFKEISDNQKEILNKLKEIEDKQNSRD